MTRVTWIGHATVLIEIAGTRIITDPVLRERLGLLRRRRDLGQVKDVGDVDTVLLSHLHHDHADLPSLRGLRGAPVVAEAENARWLRRRGLVAPQVEPDRWHRISQDVEVLLVPAQHAARPMPHRPNGAVGMLVRAPGVVIWFAGDTSLYPEMADLPRRAEAPIDLALLPIGGWGPRLSRGHMGPSEAAEAVLRSRARAVVPIHYGTLHPRGWPPARLDWSTAPADLFPDALAGRCPGSARILPVGGSLTLGDGNAPGRCGAAE